MKKKFKDKRLKLTDKQVVSMRKEWADGKKKMKDIAKKYGVSLGTTSVTVRGKSRSDVGGTISEVRGSKLSEQQRIEMRSLRRSGKTLKEIAEMFSVHIGSVSYTVGKDRENDKRFKLTDKQVVSIREEIARGKKNQRQMAKKYKVSQSTITSVGQRKTRRNVGGPIIPPRRKFSEEQRQGMRSLRKSGKILREIAEVFSTGVASVFTVVGKKKDKKCASV
jgi:DNA-binding MarR family transcriptional regulator